MALFETFCLRKPTVLAGPFQRPYEDNIKENIVFPIILTFPSAIIKFGYDGTSYKLNF